MPNHTLCYVLERKPRASASAFMWKGNLPCDVIVPPNGVTKITTPNLLRDKLTLIAEAECCPNAYEANRTIFQIGRVVTFKGKRGKKTVTFTVSAKLILCDPAPYWMLTFTVREIFPFPYIERTLPSATPPADSIPDAVVQTKTSA